MIRGIGRDADAGGSLVIRIRRIISMEIAYDLYTTPGAIQDT